MPDEVMDEGSKGEEEKRVTPTPLDSAGSEDAGSALTGTDSDSLGKVLSGVKEMLDGFEKRIPDLVDASVKSKEDRAVHRLGVKLDEMRTIVEAAGGDFGKVQPDLERNALLDRIDALESQIGSAGAGGTASRQDAQASGLSAETEEFLLEKQNEDGLTLTDDELREIAGGRRWPSDPLELKVAWFGALNDNIAKKKKQGSISPAASAGKEGRSPSGPIDDDDLIAEINELQKHPLQNVERRKELIAEATRRGIF